MEKPKKYKNNKQVNTNKKPKKRKWVPVGDLDFEKILNENVVNIPNKFVKQKSDDDVNMKFIGVAENVRKVYAK